MDGGHDHARLAAIPVLSTVHTTVVLCALCCVAYVLCCVLLNSSGFDPFWETNGYQESK